MIFRQSVIRLFGRRDILLVGEAELRHNVFCIRKLRQLRLRLLHGLFVLLERLFAGSQPLVFCFQAVLAGFVQLIVGCSCIVDDLGVFSIYITCVLRQLLHERPCFRRCLEKFFVFSFDLFQRRDAVLELRHVGRRNQRLAVLGQRVIDVLRVTDRCFIFQLDLLGRRKLLDDCVYLRCFLRCVAAEKRLGLPNTSIHLHIEHMLCVKLDAVKDVAVLPRAIVHAVLCAFDRLDGEGVFSLILFAGSVSAGHSVLERVVIRKCAGKRFTSIV